MKAVFGVFAGLFCWFTTDAIAQSVGSGFLLSEKVIATNYHVIEDAERIEVVLPGNATRVKGGIASSR